MGLGHVGYCPAVKSGPAPDKQRVIIKIAGFGGSGKPNRNVCGGIEYEEGETLGFDYYALNWDDGKTYIQRNAFVLMELIEQLQRARGLTDEDDLVIIGRSMGGLVARYTLAYMETNQRDHRAKLFMTIDSPHRGAYLPLGVQHLTKYFAEEHDDEGSQKKLADDIDSTAAKQMLLYHHTKGLNPLTEDPAPTDLFTKLYNTELRGELGDYPQAENLRKVAISHGRGDGSFGKPEPGSLLIHWRSNLITHKLKIPIIDYTPFTLSAYTDVKVRAVGSSSQPIFVATPLFELNGLTVNLLDKRSVSNLLEIILPLSIRPAEGLVADAIVAATKEWLVGKSGFKPRTIKIGTAISYGGYPGGQAQNTFAAMKVLLEQDPPLGTLISPMPTIENDLLLDPKVKDDRLNCQPWVSECFHAFIPTFSALGLDLHPSSKLLEAIGDENVGPWDKIYFQDSNRGHGEQTKTKEWVGAELALLVAGDGPAVAVKRVVTAGKTFTCSTTTEGLAYCWGAGDSGQLGNGSTDRQASPVPVSGGLTFKALTAGANHACGITTGGEAYCWGAGDRFQLGNDSTADQALPVPVSGVLNYRWLSAGLSHTCGVSTDFEAYCWGFGVSGQLGHSSKADKTVPTPVSGNHLFVSIDAGNVHTCAVKDNSGSFCWGYGGDGRLGNNSFSNATRPSAVDGSLTFQSMSLGGDHTCGIWVQGGTYCWGKGKDGQVGNGKKNSESTPELVSGNLAFTSVAAGGNHTCGITSDDKTYCWGSGDWGQLGNGSNENKLEPTLISPALP